MKIEKFRVTEGSKVNLKNHPTDFTGDYIDKKDALKDPENNVYRMSEFLFFRHDPHYPVVVFCRRTAAVAV